MIIMPVSPWKTVALHGDRDDPGLVAAQKPEAGGFSMRPVMSGLRLGVGGGPGTPRLIISELEHKRGPAAAAAPACAARDSGLSTRAARRGALGMWTRKRWI